jgi:transcriptional antiterminator NusG
MELKWYVIRAISGQEKKVKQYLESEIARLNIGDKITNILIPTEKVYDIKNGKKTVRERAYLPGYIVIQAALEPELIQLIKDINGVVGFLNYKKEEIELIKDDSGKKKSKDGLKKVKVIREVPIPLKPNEIEEILSKAEELKNMEEIPENPFVVGETIKVIEGQFIGFDGEIKEVLDDKKKLIVLVKMFGRNTPLELGYSQVERQS